MTRVFALSTPPTFTASSLILAATRCWRSARDAGRPVQAALFEMLDAHRCGILAPVFASLMTIYESCAGRPIRVGGPGPFSLSTDEHRLLGLLDRSADSETMMLHSAASSGLARAMQIAVRSTRIMMRLALETVGDIPRSPRLRSPGGRHDARQRRSGVAVHRNKKLSALVDMLRGAYPVTAQILGESGFDAVALAFARRYPPDHPTPTGYGVGFAGFLAEQPRIADISYLSDVATLERMRTEAHLAADAPALDLRDLGHIGGADKAGLSLTLHPAAGLAWLTTPAVTIWQAHHDGFGMLAPEWRAEGALVTRPAGQVALHPISRPEHRMLFGLRLRESVGQAAAATAVLYPEADTDAILATLVDSGAFAKPPHIAGNRPLAAPQLP